MEGKAKHTFRQTKKRALHIMCLTLISLDLNILIVVQGSICYNYYTGNNYSVVIAVKLYRLADDDDLAAETGVKETTKEKAMYPHPTNDKIKFWDLPGIGKYVLDRHVRTWAKQLSHFQDEMA